jgi:ankyrin repeat protein
MGGVLSVAAAVALCCAAPGCDRANGGANHPTAKSSSRPGPNDPDDPRPPDTDPSKLLFGAIATQKPDEADRIISKHPEVIEREHDGVRPLWRTCQGGSVRIATSLVEHGADLKRVNANGQTILWPAVRSDKVELVKYLIGKGADPKALQDDRETLLWGAASPEMATLLIKAGVDPRHVSALGDMAIHKACRQTRTGVVRLLLDAGVGVDVAGRWDMRPLHLAASSSYGEPRPLVMLLLERGADINSKGFRGHTALHECAMFNRLEIAELLLSRKAVVNQKDAEGKTPLDLALLAKSDRFEMIRLLYRFGDEEAKKYLPNQ